MESKLFLLMLALSLNPAFVKAQEIIAHRGYWKTGGSAQNSIASLKMAQNLEVYGSECDVFISKDGTAFLQHDAVIKGTNISVEKQSFVNIQGFITLPNGEHPPKLEDCLRQAKKGKGSKLIIEIKSHGTKEREDAAVAEVSRLVKKTRSGKKVEYISFSRHIVEKLIESNPEAEVYYLNGDIPPAELKRMGAAGLDYNISVMRKNPQWFGQAHELGLKVNVWTVNREEDIIFCMEHNADFITTDEPLMALELVRGAAK